jgi:pyrimidine operon attenuation protein / uracil phosphoribosyltransferase
MNTVATNSILTSEDVNRKIRRMAFEIAERNGDCDSVFIAGIAGNGIIVAKAIINELKDILSCPVEFITITIDKNNPLNVSIDRQINYDDKTIILVDDVANSGRILLYALKSFLEYKPRSIQTLVLVERSHKLFPVQTDYVGLSIATTLQEHITVQTEEGKISGAWLH